MMPLSAVVAVTIVGFEIALPVVLLGTFIGLTYGILAVGLVLVYRANRIINFAHGEIGAFGASLFLLFTTNDTVALHYYAALPLAIAAAMLLGAGSEVVVIRRLRRAPRIMSIVATLGLGQFILVFSQVINPRAGAGSLYPKPPGLPEFQVGPLLVTQAYFGMAVFVPLVVVIVTVFLRRSIYGLAIRGAAANGEAARMAGISTTRMSSLSWGIAGGLSGLSAILYAPAAGFLGASSFGPALLLRALVAAVVARFRSLPIALAVGIGVGIVEQLLLWHNPSGGLVEAILYVLILGGLLLQRDLAGRGEDSGSSWSAVRPLAALPDALARLTSVRALPWVVGVGTLAVAVMLPLFITSAAAIILVGLLAFVVVGLSVGIVTGLSGQLSLGQFALAAIGAVVSWRVSSQTGNFVLSVLCAGSGAALVSLVIGIPALRIKGLMLAVTTLGFALVTESWLIAQPWMVGSGVDPGRPILFGTALTSGKAYYWFALLLAVLCFLVARNVWRSGLGRQFIAVRDNEENARAFTIRATQVKLRAFLLAGFLAGVGGALYGHSLSRMSVTTFPVTASIAAAIVAVIGGVGMLSGPVLGALLVIGVPAFVPLDSAGLAASALGQLLILMYLPSGLAGLVGPIRDRVVDALARRQGLDPVALRVELSPTTDDASATSSLEGATGYARPVEADGAVDGRVLLEARGLTKRFGGIRAVDDVSFAVHVGEIVGLMGPNGAGKTTTFEMLSGFTVPDAGTVLFDGEDVTSASPESRARLGMIRSFQAAPLFPTMSVLETVKLALEKELPTRLASSLAGRTSRERAREDRARELIGLMGLESYRNQVIGELSTGTRRITEITCLIALEPKLLLLDEPASGVAQREVEAMTGLLLELKDRLRTTLCIIEHDIPMIASIADRLIAMDTGAVVAAGAPDDVLGNQHVVASYLGDVNAAVERSGALTS